MKRRLYLILPLILLLLVLSVSYPQVVGQSQAQAALVRGEMGLTSQRLSINIPADLLIPNQPDAPQACSTPVTQNIRGKDVDFDQCYERTFSHSGTNYTVHVYYTEQDTTANLNRCTASDAPGRCEHKISNNDDANGDNVNAVAMAVEVESAMRFYRDRNLPFLWSGTTMTVYIAEDPRGGGTPTCNSIMVDDEWVDNNDTLNKRLLAFHEIQHLIQCHYQPTPGWDGFYGEGIARAIEDRIENQLDQDTGHLFIPEVAGILSSNATRITDLTTYSYPTVLWWTWLMDQYSTGGESDPISGWQAIRNFYLGVPGASTTLASLKTFIANQGSSFRKDFTDYTLALYAFRFTNSDARVNFRDAEINSATSGLSGHTVITGGPAYSTTSVSLAPRSSRYWEFNPASQCQFIALTFNGGAKPYSFSVMTVDSGGNLQKRWTSYSNNWARTVRTSGLSRVVGVVTAIDDSGNVTVGRGCVTPTINIKNPTSAQFEMVGTADNPRNFITRVKVTGQEGSAVAGLTAADFQVNIQKSGGGSSIPAAILTSTYVQDDYWLLVQAPDDEAGAENGQFYNLTISLGSATDTENSALLYVPRTQDVIVVLDRSGSMGGSTGRIEAARNAGAMFFNELADIDQGGYVAFSTDAILRKPLAVVGSGASSYRQELINSINAETPSGLTSIGDGMRTAATEHDTHKDPLNQCSFILLSDGYENEPEYWADVRAGVVDNGCAIHAIGLGPGANEVLLQQIAASVPGGSYDYADTSGSVPLLSSAHESPQIITEEISWQNNLSRVYDAKAVQVAGRQRIQATMGTGRQEERYEYEFFVDDASDKLVITLAWQLPTDGFEVQLFDPDGDEVIPNSMSAAAALAGPVAVRRTFPTNDVWEITQLIPGKYILVVTNLYREFYLGLSVDSLYQLYLFIGTPTENLVQGMRVPILATFVGPGEPLLEADVIATVIDPVGVQRTVRLYDDGNHQDGEAQDGVYGNIYTITSFADGVATNPIEGEEPQINGSYLVNVVGIKGELRREAQGSFAIQRDLDENQNRLPDTWERIYGVSDPEDDPDGDKLINYCELLAGTDPLNPDTDGGGQSDGSEVPQCFVDPQGQDPHDPSDDRTRRLNIFTRPLLDLSLKPYIRIWWSLPELGDLLNVDLYRREVPASGPPGPWFLLQAAYQGIEFHDFDVEDGAGYQYRLAPLVDVLGIQVEGALEESQVILASDDPYPPGGTILINNGAASTPTRLVTLQITVDDIYGEHDGEPPADPLTPASLLRTGTISEDIQMRISNSPDFTGIPWIAYQPVVENWQLSSVPPRGVASVYVQFKDLKGNISTSGFGQVDTIIYLPADIYLPVISR